MKCARSIGLQDPTSVRVRATRRVRAEGAPRAVAGTASCAESHDLSGDSALLAGPWLASTRCMIEQTWRAILLRGLVAIGFSVVTLLLSPELLPFLSLLFGMYALVDGGI